MASKKKIEFTNFDQDTEEDLVSASKAERKEEARRKKEKEKAEKEEEKKKVKATLTTQGVVYVEDYDDEFDIAVKEKQKFSKNKLALIWGGAGLLLIVVLIILITVFANILNTGAVYDGVMLDGYSLAGMTEKQVQDYVRSTYITPLKEGVMEVKIGDTQVSYPMSEFVVCPDPEAIAKEAYGVARTGNIFSRLSQITALKSNHKNLSITYTISNEKFEDIQAAAAEKLCVEKVDPTIEALANDGIKFTYGAKGVEIDLNRLNEDLKKALQELSKRLETAGTAAPEPIALEIFTIVSDFTPIEKEAVLELAYIPPVDAYFQRVNGKVEIVPQVYGRSVAEADLDRMLDKINSGNASPNEYLVIPYDHSVSAEITEAMLQEMLDTRTLLAEGASSNKLTGGSTQLVSKNERAQNLRRAAELLNKTIVLPDEIFRFSEVVGDISIANGFIPAYDNAMGADEKTAGGGVSQAASALYLSLLKADIEITEHAHYPYPVNFGTLGLDAYVSKNQDFSFRNSSSVPLRIEASYIGDLFTIRLYGAKAPENTIEITADSQKTAYETIYEIDPALQDGEEIHVPGFHGYRVTVSRRVISGGVVISDKTLEIVSYQSRNETIYRSGAATPDPTEPTPPPSPTAPETEPAEATPSSSEQNTEPLPTPRSES